VSVTKEQAYLPCNKVPLDIVHIATESWGLILVIIVKKTCELNFYISGGLVAVLINCLLSLEL
jgi:hypothetical protein